MKISEQFYFMKENGNINLGRFPSSHIRKILASGSISIYYQKQFSPLIEKGIPDGDLSFNINENLRIDKSVLDNNCVCKINVYTKNNKYVMKIKAVKGGE
jgi:hypothetical protein